MVDIRKPAGEMTDVEWLEATGAYIFGDRGWISALAREIGVSQQFLSFVVKGKRTLSAEHSARLAQLCSDWINDVTRRRVAIEQMETAWRRIAEEKADRKRRDT